MIVIAKEAEKKLQEELVRQKQDLSQIKCLHLVFSKLDVDKKKLFDNFLELIEQVPESYLAEVYVCEDQDVFILMHAFMQNAFADAIKELEKSMKVSFEASILHSYSLDEHHMLLEELCTEKQQKLEAHDQKAKETTSNLKTVAEILSVLEMNLVETLARRRETRREVEVLVIEDDQLSRTLVANTISPKYSSLSATTGTEGLELFLEHAPDVVFLDIGLPDINGHDVLECMFKLDPNAYVIMFSGRKDKENIMRALRAGAQGFIGKPFTREKLFEYIAKSPFIQKKVPKAERVKQASA